MTCVLETRCNGCAGSAKSFGARRQPLKDQAGRLYYASSLPSPLGSGSEICGLGSLDLLFTLWLSPSDHACKLNYGLCASPPAGVVRTRTREEKRASQREMSM